ncbi:MAG: hypothetical protein NW201_12755 [Gemmatimonadales bacterium]|nr:hypothetical protein [Gemmatimonadales bacterium]
MSAPSIRPRDFLRLDDGSWYAVTAEVTPDGRIPVLERYAPSGRTLAKVPAVRARGGAVVPARVREHRMPGPRLRVLRAAGRLASPLERLAVRIAGLLEVHGVPRERLGVTGSLLISPGRPDSDVDLVVRGRTAFHAARRAVVSLLLEGTLQPLDAAAWEAAWRRRASAIDLEAYRAHERRKFTRALLDGVRLDLTMVPDEAELAEEPRCAAVEGRHTLTATVLDATRAFDHPARLVVAHPAVQEVVVWTNTYVGQAFEGETIEAAGVLERDALGRRRLVVGTSRAAPGEWVVVPALTSRAPGTPRSADPRAPGPPSPRTPAPAR